MELTQIQNNSTAKEDIPFKIYLTSTRQNNPAETIPDEISSNVDCDKDSIHILGRGPLLQITDSRVSR